MTFVADVGHDRHDELFADRVNRRIRHLCEELVEVVEEKVRFFGETGESRVIPHGTHGFVPSLGHRAKDQLDILQCVAETCLFTLKVAGNLRSRQGVHRQCRFFLARDGYRLR